MRRFKIYESHAQRWRVARFKISKLIIGSFCLFTFAFLLPVSGCVSQSYAASSASASAKTASASGNLADKLEVLKKEIASKAAALKGVINKKLQNRAAVGEITNISGSEIMIQTFMSSKTVRTNEYTEYSAKIKTAKGKVNLDTLKEGDYVAALGDEDDKNVLTAKRIIVTTPLASDSGKFVWGQIQTVSGTTISLKDKDNQIQKIRTSNANYALGVNEASIQDAKIGVFMVAKGTENSDKSLGAKYVYFIPNAGYIKPVATASAATSPSPSAKVSTPSAKPKR